MARLPFLARIAIEQLRPIKVIYAALVHGFMQKADALHRAVRTLESAIQLLEYWAFIYEMSG